MKLVFAILIAATRGAGRGAELGRAAQEHARRALRRGGPAHVHGQRAQGARRRQGKRDLELGEPEDARAGDVTVLRTFESKGLPCKEVRVRNEAQGRKNTSKLSPVPGRRQVAAR